MSTHADRVRRARERSSQATVQAPTPVAPQQAPAGYQPPLDQSAIISTSGEARVVPNDHSAHMRAKAAGEGNVQDYNAARAAERARAAVGGDAQVYAQPGAKNVRPHLPEGSQNVRSSPNHRRGPTGHRQSAVRDRQARAPAQAGAGNVQSVRGRMNDVGGATLGVAGRRPGAGGSPFPPNPAAQRQMQQPAPQQPMQPMPPQPMPQQAPAQPQPQPPQQANPAGPTGPVPIAIGPRAQGEVPGDVTVIIATFRRPHMLRPQLQALADQTVRAADLWVWSNDWGQGAGLHDHEAESHYTFFRSKFNLGPWVRFSIAAEVQTKYVLILDDDCIPGPGWIQACIERLEAMENQGELGVICASGRVFGGDDPTAFVEVGPSHPENEEAIVDEGTKAWFLPIGVLDLFNAFPRAMSPVGWGLHMAAACQSAGIFQLVLPYDPDDRSIWGNVQPNTDQASVSQSMPQYAEARAAAWNFYRDPEVGGWAPIALLDESADQGGEAEPEPTADPEPEASDADSAEPQE